MCPLASQTFRQRLLMFPPHVWFILIFTQFWMIVLCGEKLALLSATLRTYQKAACDTDQIAIACPRGTSISIEFAQYNKFIAKDGINIEDLCTVSGDDNKERSRAKYLLRGSTFGAPVQKVLPNRYANAVYLPEMAITVNDITNGTTPLNAHNNEEQSIENCQWPHSLQYSLLQTVVEACQKKKHCKFGRPQFYGMGASGVGDTTGTSSYHSSTVTSNTINVDPCPKKRKIVEVSYKCRPYEFRSKVACHNDVAQLECNPYSRIAVYSASFGRTEYESIQCPQPQGVREETCLASYSTETVMQICHGRRRCNLAADANTFGTPCQPNSKMYLKVVYTCVPKQVLMERYESEMEADEPEDFDGDINELYDDEYYKESEAIPKLYSNTTAIATRNSDNGTTFNTLLNPLNKAINGTLLTIDSDAGSSNPLMTHSADLILEDHQEPVFFYLLSIGSIGVIVCVVIVLARFVVLRRVVLTNNSHLTNTVKGGNDMEVGRTGDSTVNISIGETVIPNVYNDSMPEVSADINLVTAMSMPSVSKNENYINYGPTSSLYGLCNNLLPPPSSAGTVVPSPALHHAGTAQSPDILNAAAQKYSPANSSPTISSSPLNAGVLAPAIVIGAAGCSTISSSTVIGAVVPIKSLAQYTTAPTFRSGYIINTENILQRPPNTMPSTISITRAEAYLNLNQKYSQQHQLQLLKQHQLPPQQMEMVKSSGSSAITTAATYNTLRHYKSPSLSTPPVLQPQPLATSTPSAYDGTLPRTLPTGMPVNSPFYYG